MRAWILLPCLALAAAACGSDDTSGGAGGAAGAAGAAGAGGEAGQGGAGAAGQGGAAGTAGQGGAGAGGEAGQGGGGAGGEGGQGGAAGGPVRTVETRSPFGDLTVGPNLVLDGDFEFSPTSTIVPAWLGIKAQQAVSVTYETGGRCFSGVYCARVVKGVTVANFAVSLPPGVTVEASVRVRPPADKCKNIVQLNLSASTATDSDGVSLKSADAAPDATGWCTYSGKFAVPEGTRQASLYAINTQSAPVVIDHAVVRPLAEQAQVTSAPLSAAERQVARSVEGFRPRRPVRQPRLDHLPRP